MGRPGEGIKAEVAAINARLKSRRQVVAGRGWDVAQLDREIAEDAVNASAPAAAEGAAA